ncbi:MAG TPA: alpha/beta hydrolase [Oligoflexia bacterium]|nr:alpha/beta hydrolase [Oligoflexia bacterium]HMP47217.1 alpha/beta hydrolase [Oligoflexia bacterium]
MFEFFLSILTIVFLVSAATVATQNLQVFPGALFGLFGKLFPIKENALPHHVVSSFIITPDGKRLEVWYLPANSDTKKSDKVGIIFHGNGGSVESFILAGLWFQEQGISSYLFDYRGFGKSTGWPTEKGIYIDSEAVINWVIEKEKTSANNLVLMGISLGSAPASLIAMKYKPWMLILLSPFRNFRSLIGDYILFRHLKYFSFFRLPVDEYVSELTETSLVLLHGGKDKIISSRHSEIIKNEYKGSGKVELSIIPLAGHNNVLYLGWERLKDMAKEVGL